MIVTVDLDGAPLLDGVVAQEREGRLFVPLCSLAEPLSLAIRCSGGRAYGFVLDESRPFLIDLEEGVVMSVREVSQVGDAAFSEGNDILVDILALSRWWPVDFTYDKHSSYVHAHARETLPLQRLKKRQQTARKNAPPPPQKRLYPEASARKALASIPSVDFTSQFQLAGEGGSRQAQARSSLQMAGDLLYLSGFAHVAVDNEGLQRVDLSLYKRQEPPFRIGPLPVTQLVIGATQATSVDGVGGSSATMYGFSLSNRPITASSQFLAHDIDGHLPDGWDAELLHNGIPVAYQPAGEDGMYHFRNLRVQYGINDFKVILHGPFGETRLSEQTFLTDSTTPRGDFLYTFSTAWQSGVADQSEPGTGRESNLTFTSDFGITEGLTGSTVFVRRIDAQDVEEDFVGVGMRTALGYTLLSLDVLQRFSPQGGEHGQLFTARSSGRYFSDLAAESTLRFFHDFSSPQFERQDDPLLAQAVLKGSTSFEGWYGIRFPFAAQVTVDTRRSGGTDVGSAWRVSGGWNGWNAALGTDLSYRQREVTSAGVLQISTRFRDTSIRGQAGFCILPEISASTVNVSADQEVGNGYLLNSGITHDAVGGISTLRVGLSKRFGLLGYSLSATGDTNGAYSFNVAVSTSLAADRVNAQLVLSSEPLSSYGMIAASASLAAVPGAPAKTLPNVGFLVNGSRAITVTGTAGFPVIGYLQPDIPVEITVDLTTVEDPFMVPVEEGCHIVPRAGVVSSCRFTMATGGEIDGMVLIRPQGGAETPLKGVQVNLVKEGGAEVAATTVTEESGYYLFRAVRPGRYLVTVPQTECSRLKADPSAAKTVTMPEGGDQVTGNDFILTPRPRGS